LAAIKRVVIRAGADAQQRVQRAKAHETGAQRHHTQPTPDAKGAGERQANQHQAQNNTQNAVDTANVGFHNNSLVKRRRSVSDEAAMTPLGKAHRL
jgi:hypothetical protein